MGPQFTTMEIPQNKINWLRISCVPNIKRLLENPDTFNIGNTFVDELVEFRNLMRDQFLFEELTNSEEET